MPIFLRINDSGNLSFESEQNSRSLQFYMDYFKNIRQLNQYRLSRVDQLSDTNDMKNHNYRVF